MTENLSGLPYYAQQLLPPPFPPFRVVLWDQCILTLLSVLFLTACDGKVEQQATIPRPVRTIVVPSSLSERVFTRIGEIRPHDEVPLGFRLDGRLLTRAVDVGDTVTAGQFLGTLESKTPKNQLDSARSDLDSALAAERLAALTLKRMRQLMPSGAIALIQLDTARADWQAAVSRRQSSEAALNTAQENLGWTRLIAPTAGVVTQINAQPGQVLSSGQTAVTLAVNNSRDAVIDVAEPQVFSHDVGELNISLTTDPTIHVSGTLRDISPQADPQTRTWRVRISLRNPPPTMELGASVQVEVSASGPPMIALPASSLTWTDGKPAVFVVDKVSRELALRPITLGGYTASEIQVSSGIVQGELVVTAGVSKLRQGEKVTYEESQE